MSAGWVEAQTETHQGNGMAFILMGFAIALPILQFLIPALQRENSHTPSLRR